MLQLPSCSSSKEKNIKKPLGILLYHESVQTNNTINKKKAFRNKPKQHILVTA